MGHPRLPSSDLNGKSLLYLRRSWKEGLHELRKSHLQPWWSHNGQGRSPFRELRIEDKEGNAAKMVPMKMRNEDRANIIGGGSEPFHGYQGRRSAVDKKFPNPCFREHAHIEAPATPEGIAAAQEL
jgi:hypothetical protein